MIANNDSNIKHLSKLVGPLQDCNIPEGAAKWLIKNCHELKLQTHCILSYIIDKQCSFPEEYLEFSKVVVVGDEIEEFCDLYWVNRLSIQKKGAIFENI